LSIFLLDELLTCCVNHKNSRGDAEILVCATRTSQVNNNCI